MEFFIMSFILSAVFIIALFIYMPVNGKFWHKHDWYEHFRVEVPSIYSKKKTNLHVVNKCQKDNCSAFRINVYPINKEKNV